MFAVIETASFLRAVERTGLTEDETFEIVKTVSENPTIGDLIPGTGGARKWRVPMKGKGKRGGGRVISYFASEDMPVWLLDIFSKGEKIDLTARERAMLKQDLEKLAADYREGMRRRLVDLKEQER
jgi:hypothetical protein